MNMVWRRVKIWSGGSLLSFINRKYCGWWLQLLTAMLHVSFLVQASVMQHDILSHIQATHVRPLPMLSGCLPNENIRIVAHSRPEYPLSLPMLRRSAFFYGPYSTNGTQEGETSMMMMQLKHRLTSAFSYLHQLQNSPRREDETFNIVVFGGSVTKGGHCYTDVNGGCYTFDCEPKSKGAYCGWFYLFARTVRHFFSNVKFKFINLAVGGSFMEEIVNSGIDEYRNIIANNTQVHLVLVDKSTNDNANLKYLKEKYPGDEDALISQHHAYVEQAIRDLLESSKETMVWFLEYFHFGSSSRASFFLDKDLYQSLCSYYRVPLISYSTMVFPDYISPKEGQFCEPILMSNALDPQEALHPAWYSAQLIADTVSYHFIGHYTRITTDLVSIKLRARKYPKPKGILPTGTEMVIHLNAKDGSNGFLASNPPGCWDLYEDRPGKPGWITNSSSPCLTLSSLKLCVPTNIFQAGDTLYFKVGYLKSYEHMGAVKIETTQGSFEKQSFLVDGVGGDKIHILDGFWAQDASQTYSSTFEGKVSEMANQNETLGIDFTGQFNTTKEQFQQFKIMWVKVYRYSDNGM